MEVHQIFLNNSYRNFNYLIEMEHGVYITDPFDASVIEKKLKEIGKPALAILITHEHWDHVSGVKELKEKLSIPVWAHANGKGTIENVDQWVVDDYRCGQGEDQIFFKATPGHTMGHMCLFLEHDFELEGVIVGDTVFTAGVGNCHNGGDPAALYETLKSIFYQLPDTVKLYPSHDYAQTNLKFTLNVDPNNNQAKELLNGFESGELDSTNFVSTIGIEKNINSFFRVDSRRIRSTLSMENNSDKEVFLTLREKRNNW